jgi:hypothetical protein
MNLRRPCVETTVLLVVAAVALAVHLVFYEGYGYFRDELYFLACARHLDWGYVDQPPGVAVVAWLSQAVFGDTLFAVRIVPILFATALVAVAGLTARAMGGALFAQLLAAICVLASPYFFATYLNTDMFMDLGWAVCALFIARALAGGSPKLWLAVGVAAGLTFEGKHAIVFFALPFLLALLLTAQRHLLKEPWLWAGVAIACVLALPNVLWEYAHGWPTWELLGNIAASDKNVVRGPLAYLLTNVEYAGPVALPVWLAGLAWCGFAREGRPFRAFAWTWLLALALFIALKGKSYYLMPIYSTLLASGAVAIEQWLAGVRPQTARWSQVLIAGLVLLGGIVAWPLAMPMLPVEQFLRYQAFLHLAPPRTETQPLGALPQQYADMFGWPEMAVAVARVHSALPASERSSCGILATNYGEAGAIDEFGPRLGLPPAISGHQNYWLWGPRGYDGSCLVVIGGSLERLQGRFVEVARAGEADHPLAIPGERHLPIWIVHRTRQGNLESLWPALKNWR